MIVSQYSWGRRVGKLSQQADSAPKPLGDRLPAFGRNGMPLVRKARRAEHDFETVECAVADKRLFARTGRYLNVLEGLEQFVELSLADRAFPWHEFRVVDRRAGRKAISNNQRLPLGQIEALRLFSPDKTNGASVAARATGLSKGCI